MPPKPWRAVEYGAAQPDTRRLIEAINNGTANRPEMRDPMSWPRVDRNGPHAPRELIDMEKGTSCNLHPYRVYEVVDIEPADSCLRKLFEDPMMLFALFAWNYDKFGNLKHKPHIVYEEVAYHKQLDDRYFANYPYPPENDQLPPPPKRMRMSSPEDSVPTPETHSTTTSFNNDPARKQVRDFKNNIRQLTVQFEELEHTNEVKDMEIEDLKSQLQALGKEREAAQEEVKTLRATNKRLMQDGVVVIHEVMTRVPPLALAEHMGYGEAYSGDHIDGILNKGRVFTTAFHEWFTNGKPTVSDSNGVELPRLKASECFGGD